MSTGGPLQTLGVHFWVVLCKPSLNQLTSALATALFGVCQVLVTFVHQSRSARNKNRPVKAAIYKLFTNRGNRSDNISSPLAQSSNPRSYRSAITPRFRDYRGDSHQEIGKRQATKHLGEARVSYTVPPRAAQGAGIRIAL